MKEALGTEAGRGGCERLGALRVSVPTSVIQHSDQRRPPSAPSLSPQQERVRSGNVKENRLLFPVPMPDSSGVTLLRCFQRRASQCRLGMCFHPSPSEPVLPAPRRNRTQELRTAGPSVSSAPIPDLPLTFNISCPSYLFLRTGVREGRRGSGESQ